ncbi:hypothetical protein [Ottowia beijingensis]|uniref:hypothetical protein n=1 Tax=Ottowia beijingensis TaxID=1207057 RepID=UPI0028049D9A|nr:hypothetical protein [Ottowia beijingensis]
MVQLGQRDAADAQAIGMAVEMRQRLGRAALDDVDDDIRVEHVAQHGYPRNCSWMRPSVP